MHPSMKREPAPPVMITDLSFKSHAEISTVPGWKFRDKSIVQNMSDSVASVWTFWGPVVILDFILGLSLIFVNHPLPGGAPGGLITAIAVILLGITRPGALIQQYRGVWVFFSLALVAFLVLESHMNGMPFIQRIMKIALFMSVPLVIASGKIDVRSLLMGGMVGALVNVPAFYAGLTPNAYPPYLTGFYGDKNVAGFYYALWGILGIMVFRTRKMRIAWLALMLVLLFLTGSRTSMFAMMLAIVWVLARNRTNVQGRIGLIVAAVLGAPLFERSFAQNDFYGDRRGTDELRSRIEQLMTAKADATPWYGKGLNQSVVQLQDGTFFFHNSYTAAFVEGGYPLIAYFIILFGVVGLGVLHRGRNLPSQLILAQAGCVVVLVCAWKLGEVFITFGAFMTVGIACAFAYGRIRPVDDVEEGLPVAYRDLVRQNVASGDKGLNV